MGLKSTTAMHSEGYILEAKGETDRLERQALLDPYRADTEFFDFPLKSGGSYLDAGTGSGVVVRYLYEKARDMRIGAKFSGCDASELRVSQAKKLNPPSVGFFACNLEHMPEIATNTYDGVTCRYVIEHCAKPDAVVAELARVTKIGGHLRLVDVDGLMCNLMTEDKVLDGQLKRLAEHSPVDLFAGRKLAHRMHQAGLVDLSWKVTAHSFQGALLEAEVKQMQERLTLARPALIQVFGSEKSAGTFVDRFLQELSSGKVIYFFNKFIVTGVKSER